MSEERTDSAYKLFKALDGCCIENGYSENEILSFLTACLTGTMEMKGYSEGFFCSTLDKMKEKFIEKRKERLKNLKADRPTETPDDLIP
jgi:hypothetical protein